MFTLGGINSKSLDVLLNKGVCPVTVRLSVQTPPLAFSVIVSLAKMLFTLKAVREPARPSTAVATMYLKDLHYKVLWSFEKMLHNYRPFHFYNNIRCLSRSCVAILAFTVHTFTSFLSHEILFFSLCIG